MRSLTQFQRFTITDVPTKRKFLVVAAFSELHLRLLAEAMIDKGLGGIELEEGFIAVCVKQIDGPVIEEPAKT